jgi:hypothetical protein
MTDLDPLGCLVGIGLVLLGAALRWLWDVAREVCDLLTYHDGEPMQ